jgi:prefoldin subunit 5
LVASRRLLKRVLEELQLIEKQISQLDQEIADLLLPTERDVDSAVGLPIVAEWAGNPSC